MHKAAAAPQAADAIQQIRAAAAKGWKPEKAEPEWWAAGNAITLDSTTNIGPEHLYTSGVYVANALPMTQTYSGANLGLP